MTLDEQTLSHSERTALASVLKCVACAACAYRAPIYVHLHRCVVAGLVASTGVSDVLLKLLQTVEHSLPQQLASSGCPSDATFTWNRPQLLHTGTQPGQVTTNLLKIGREEKGM